MTELSTVTSINGKPLTKPEMNLLKKLETKHGVKPLDSTSVQVQNPFTEVCAVTDSVTAALIKFVQGTAYSSDFSYGGKTVAVNDFDRTRYLVMRVDNSTYFTILD